MNRIVAGIALILGVCGLVVGFVVATSRSGEVAAARAEVAKVKAAPDAYRADAITTAFSRRDAAEKLQAERRGLGAIVGGLGLFAGAVLLVVSRPRNATAASEIAAGEAKTQR